MDLVKLGLGQTYTWPKLDLSNLELIKYGLGQAWTGSYLNLVKLGLGQTWINIKNPGLSTDTILAFSHIFCNPLDCVNI